MFNFERIFQKAEDYISNLGVGGGVGGALGLYAFAGVRDMTALFILAASSTLPAMILKRSGRASDEMMLDAAILAGPLLAMYFQPAIGLTINNAFFFSVGAMMGSAAYSALMNGKSGY